MPKNRPLAKPDLIHDRCKQRFQLLCLFCKPEPIFFTSGHVNTRNPALCPKTVVEVLLKRCHQHHLAADHLVWTACAEVGLKKIRLRVSISISLMVYLDNVSIGRVLYVCLYTGGKLAEQPAVVDPS